jgi:hypothetical protein
MLPYLASTATIKLDAEATLLPQQNCIPRAGSLGTFTPRLEANCEGRHIIHFIQLVRTNHSIAKPLRNDFWING